mmetsp:Transcript_5295/g.17248  ORF Transcript_5295/g.17248 Transcript_5295/m.17248 type:complete len:227 (-) Transcript_5295:159-839(-)
MQVSAVAEAKEPRHRRGGAAHARRARARDDAPVPGGGGAAAGGRAEPRRLHGGRRQDREAGQGAPLPRRDQARGGRRLRQVPVRRRPGLQAEGWRDGGRRRDGEHNDAAKVAPPKPVRRAPAALHDPAARQRQLLGGRERHGAPLPLTRLVVPLPVGAPARSSTAGARRAYARCARRPSPRRRSISRTRRRRVSSSPQRRGRPLPRSTSGGWPSRRASTRGRFCAR